MGVRLGTPPPAAERAAEQGVRDVTRTARFKTAGGAALTTTAAENVSLTSAHEMRHVGLTALTGHRPLDDSQTVGWRYLVEAGGSAVASAEVGTEAAGGSTFTALNEGPFVEATAEALRALESRPEVAASDYRVRMLKVPALYVAALWLEDLEGDEDLVLPLPPAPPFLDTSRLYREQEFLDTLAGPARERLAFDDTPQEP